MSHQISMKKAAESDELLCSLLEEGRARAAREAAVPTTTITAVAMANLHGRDDEPDRWDPTHALACMRAAVWFFNTVALVFVGIVVGKLLPQCKTTDEVFICIFALFVALGIPVMGYCAIKATKDLYKR
uniref:Uncharacterized protein n=1 Tax=Leersia perrieri TaxID=77586 RepID=A0A0D9WW07_9ORYZ